MMEWRFRKMNQKDKDIIRTLQKTRVGMSLYQISKDNGIAWVTVKKHVKKLIEYEIVIEKGDRYILNLEKIFA